MMTRRRFIISAFMIAFWLRPPAGADRLLGADPLPPRLADREFWRLVTDLSEPNGVFRSDNLLSNELFFQGALSKLVSLTRPGRAYLGVGPEQNFTYIAALRPAVAFIIDIRRGNLDLQLMYKALFELSTDRADFVSRLFSRARPPALGASASPVELFGAYGAVGPSADLYRQNLASIRRQLVTVHSFPLSEDDMGGIENAFGAFYSAGPQIQYSPFRNASGTVQPTYAQLMAATDESGVPRGFLSTEETFAVVKAYQHRNLVVPIVGNFAGPKAIRAVGRYIRAKRTKVSAFYVSNVEEYLTEVRVWKAWCANVASLPFDESSTFVRAVLTDAPGFTGMGFRTELVKAADVVRGCTPAR